MINAAVVAQVMSVTKVTQTRQVAVGPREAGEGGGCCCCRHDDFNAILDDISARNASGMSPHPLFSTAIQDGGLGQMPSSEMVGFFAGMLNGETQTTATQDPFEFMQSLSSQQRSSFQTFNYLEITAIGTDVNIEDAQSLLQQVAGTMGGIGSEPTENQWRFPPPSAPQEIRDAWDRASMDASEADKILVAGMFIGISMGMMEGSWEDDAGSMGTVSEQSSPNELTVDELDRYWQQVETLLALIDQALEKSPERADEIEGAQKLLGDFLDELGTVA